MNFKRILRSPLAWIVIAVIAIGLLIDFGQRATSGYKDAPTSQVIRRIRLPYALPYLFSATRTCVGLSLIGAVLAEWYALVDQGLGRRIQEAIDFNQTRQLWASIYAVAILGGLAILVLNVVERRVLHWHASTRTVR